MPRLYGRWFRLSAAVQVVMLASGLALLLLSNSQTQSFLSHVVYRADDSYLDHRESNYPNARHSFLLKDVLVNGALKWNVSSRRELGAEEEADDPDVSSESRAVCIGSNVTRGEVEDILCMPKLNYIPTLKNPCWWEEVIPATLSPDATPGTPARHLSCLPYFHILCCSKCGTTDLFHRLRLHPQILPNNGYLGGKELLFWAWAKNGYRGRWEKGTPAPFEKYVQRFSTVAQYVETTLEEKKSDQYVTLDGSPGDMWDFRGWPLLPQNRGLREPVVLTPHLMKHVYRNPKFIVLVREPVERLYTAYLFFHRDETPQSFHRAVVRSIAIMDSCLTTAPSRRECYFNESVVDSVPVDFPYNCYAVFFKEWLAVFPRKHFLFVRTEDYSKNMKMNLLKIFEFLNLPPPSRTVMQQMLKVPLTYHTVQKDRAGPMLPETRALLQSYMRSCNEELAELLEDERYLWDDVYSNYVYSNTTN